MQIHAGENGSSASRVSLLVGSGNPDHTSVRKSAEPPCPADSLSHDSLAVASATLQGHTRRSLGKPQPGPTDSAGNRVETPTQHRLLHHRVDSTPWMTAQAPGMNRSSRVWRAMEQHPISQERPTPPALNHDPSAASRRRMTLFRKTQACWSSFDVRSIVLPQLRDSLYETILFVVRCLPWNTLG